MGCVDIIDDREDSASLESLQMTPAKPHRKIETRDQSVLLLSRQTTAFALESAENEGWNMGRLCAESAMGSVSPIRKMSRDFVRSIAREWASWAGTRELSLKQLHAELVASAFPSGHDAESKALIALIAADLRDAEKWPIAGCGPGSARPLSAWRARYNGIDRCLRYMPDMV